MWLRERERNDPQKCFSPKQTKYGDGECERDERHCVSGCVHGLHVEEIQ